jgi:hypothetical protein
MMPRELVKSDEATRKRTLGWLAVWWIETFVVHGPGDVQGEDIVHTDEYTGFILDCYALKKNGRRCHSSAFLSRPKGTNKSGLAGELVLFEALGPCRFAGWAKGGETYEFLGKTYTYKKGEPMGKAVNVPYVRIMATEEDQTGNVYGIVKYNLEEGYLAQLKAYGMMVGNTKVSLPFGGEIMPSTTGAASKDGGKETFVVFDESHLYTTSSLRNMYATVSRNLPKRAAIAETWSLETTTMYSPGQESIAEQTFQFARMIMESKEAVARGEKATFKLDNLLYDHRWGECEDLSDDEALAAAIIESYGDAMEWNSVEGVMGKIFDPRTTVAESRRYYLNDIVSEQNSWVEIQQLRKRLVPVFAIPPKTPITLGFDGAVSDDATALIGCVVETAEIFVIKIWEKPDIPLKDKEGNEIKWEVDPVAVDAAVAMAMKTWKVYGFFADPPYWQTYVDKWDAEYGEKMLVEAQASSPIKWWTKRDTQMVQALDRAHDEICNETGIARIQEHKVLVRHILNARVWERPAGNVIGKESKKSPKKIDACMAAVLAFEARAAYLHHGDKPKNAFVPRRVDKR